MDVKVFDAPAVVRINLAEKPNFSFKYLAAPSAPSPQVTIIVSLILILSLVYFLAFVFGNRIIFIQLGNSTIKI